MTYLIDRKNGNRIYRADEKECMMLEPYQNEWIICEMPENCEQISDQQAAVYEKALTLAHKAHAGQKDKGGQDYISHPVTVSSFTEGPFVSVVAALLHDVVEDTPYTLDDLRKMGFPEEIVNCVDSLTRREDEKRSEYLARVARNTDAIYVKLADLRHNSDLSRIPNVTQKDFYRTEKYRRESGKLRAVLEERKAKAEQ